MIELAPQPGLADHLLPSAGPSKGQTRLYSYSHRTPGIGHHADSAHAVIATLWDFFDTVPYALERSLAGQGWAHDGRLHYANDALLAAIAQDYPLPGCASHEAGPLIRQALSRRGLQNQEELAPAQADGGQEREDLCNWISQLQLPVITLLQSSWLGSPGADQDCQWGVVFGEDASGVWLALGQDTLHLSWARFMAAWQAAALGWPFSYYAIYTRA